MILPAYLPPCYFPVKRKRITILPAFKIAESEKLIVPAAIDLPVNALMEI
jgi:hypothetical protein